MDKNTQKYLEKMEKLHHDLARQTANMALSDAVVAVYKQKESIDVGSLISYLLDAVSSLSSNDFKRLQYEEAAKLIGWVPQDD